MKRNLLSRHLALVGATLLMGSCSSSSKKSGSAGELDNGVFHYGCANEQADVACETTGEPEFPTAIALGGRFLLDYVPKGDNSPGTVVASVPERVSEAGGDFTMEMPGFTAMLARSSSGEVLDIKHVHGVDVYALKVRRAGALEIDELFIGVDETQAVWAVPADEQGDILAGTLSFTWSTDDESIVRLDSAANAFQVQLLGVAEGSTNVHVTSGDLTTTIPVTVGEGTGTGSTGGSDTSTGGSDTGTGGSDTGTSTGGAT